MQRHLLAIMCLLLKPLHCICPALGHRAQSPHMASDRYLHITAVCAALRECMAHSTQAHSTQHGTQHPGTQALLLLCVHLYELFRHGFPLGLMGLLRLRLQSTQGISHPHRHSCPSTSALSRSLHLLLCSLRARTPSARSSSKASSCSALCTCSCEQGQGDRPSSPARSWPG